MPSGPGKADMPGFPYRLFLADGTDVGEASHAVVIRPDNLIHVEGDDKVRVLALVPVPARAVT
jgi:hypothetical protein